MADSKEGERSISKYRIKVMKNGNPIEPDFEPSIGLVQDPTTDAMCPIWVRGGIPI